MKKKNKKINNEVDNLENNQANEFDASLELTDAVDNQENTNKKSKKDKKEKKNKKAKKEKDADVSPVTAIDNSEEKKQREKDENELNFNELKDYGTALGLSEEKIKEVSENIDYKLINTNTELVLNIKTFNRYIDYLPSDFTSEMVKRLFILKKKMNLPKDCKLKVQLAPNDTEKYLRVIVSVSSYYNQGVVIEQTKIFKPFYVIGFNTYSLIVTLDKPVEAHYRINNMHAFSFAQTQNMRKHKILPKFTNKTKSNFEVEEDFERARANKNWFLQQYTDNLNRIKNLEWECIPRISINWSARSIKINLYLKIDKIKQDYRKSKNVYVDSFTVVADDLLNIPKETRIVDVDSIMYLIALNAIYKNIKIFSYKTLYECYKIMCSELLAKGFKLKPISPNNLATLKIVDFSKHFWCKNLLFNDAILHIMNLMSSQEEYYRMKYAYTVQKDPTLLFSDFIVKEFKNVKTNELSTIIKNQQDKYWKEQLKKIDELNNVGKLKNKDFYINNYNVLDLTDNAYTDVESYLMGVIKAEKDEISRISKLGQELLRIDEDPRFTKKESAELRKVAKKLDDNYNELFKNITAADIKKAKKIKPIKLEKVRKNDIGMKDKQENVEQQQNVDPNQQYSNEGVNNG